MTSERSENGHLSFNALHGQESDFFQLNFNWRRKVDRVRQYPSRVTVVRPGPRTKRDAKTQQIRQEGQAVRLVKYARNRASRGTGKRRDG